MKVTDTDVILELTASESTEQLIWLVSITGGDLDGPLRLCNADYQVLSTTDTSEQRGVISNGLTYYNYNIEITPPADEADSETRAILTAKDVTRNLMPYLAFMTSEWSATLSLVSSLDIDTSLLTVSGLVIRGYSADIDGVSFEMVVDMLDWEPLPGYLFGPSIFKRLLS